jgi:putative ABC transport system ATP-binding protein
VILHDALRICEFLRPIELFKTLTPRQLTDVTEKMSKRHYAAGETIVSKGDAGTEFFLISDGEVEIIRADREVARLGRGDFFGEVALISGEPRNATVVAQTAVDAYVLGKTDFEAALATSQSFRDQLYRIISCATRRSIPGFWPSEIAPGPIPLMVRWIACTMRSSVLPAR